MDALGDEFRHHAALLYSPQVRKCDLNVVESYFSNLKKHPDAVQLCLLVIINADGSFDSSCAVLASQIVHQVMKYSMSVDSEVPGRILECAQTVVNSRGTAYPAAVITQLLLAISVIISKDIIKGHITKAPNASLLQIMTRVSNQLPWWSLVKVLGFIPESIKAGRYYTKCSSEQATRYMVAIYSPLLSDFCQLLPSLVNDSSDSASAGEASADLQLVICATNWIEAWLDLNEASTNGLVNTVANDIYSVISGTLTARAVDSLSALLLSPGNEVDNNEVDTVMNFMGGICETSACCEVGVVAVQQLVPLFCKLLQGCQCSPVEVGEESRMYIVFRCLPLWFQPLSSTVLSAVALPAWCMLVQALVGCLQATPFGTLLEFSYYESSFSLMLSLLESFTPAAAPGGMPSVLMERIQQLLGELIKGTMYAPSCTQEEGQQLLARHRCEFRDSMRELLALRPDVSMWILVLSIEKLNAIQCVSVESLPGCWQEAEASLHCLSACSRCLVSDPAVAAGVATLVSLLASPKVLIARPLCVMAVVLIAEFSSCSVEHLVPEVWNRALSVVLLSLLHREDPAPVAAAPHMAWTVLSFRTKEDHIGAVSLLKLAKLGFYSSEARLPGADVDLVTESLALFRDQPVGVVWAALESRVQSPSGQGHLEMLLNLCLYCTLCPSGVLMTWKSTQLVLDAAFTACAMSASGAGISGSTLSFVCDRLGPLVSLLVLLVDRSEPSTQSLSGLLSGIQSSPSVVKLSLWLGQEASGVHNLAEACEGLSTAVGALNATWRSPDGPLLILDKLLFPLFEILLNKLPVLSEDESSALCKLLLSCCWFCKDQQPPSALAEYAGRTAQIFKFLVKRQSKCHHVWLGGIASHINYAFAVGQAVSPQQLAVDYFVDVWGGCCEYLMADARPADICALVQLYVTVCENVGVTAVPRSGAEYWLSATSLKGIMDLTFRAMERQYCSQVGDRRMPVWKAVVALAAVLMGPSGDPAQPKDRLAMDVVQGDRVWIQHFVDCGAAQLLFHCLLLGLVGGIPSPYRNEIIALLQRYYVSLGSTIASEFFAASIAQHPLCLYVKENKRAELVSSLHASSKRDWKKFKDGLKVLSRMTKK